MTFSCLHVNQCYTKQTLWFKTKRTGTIFQTKMGYLQICSHFAAWSEWGRQEILTWWNGGGEKKGGCHNISKTFDSSAKVLFATGKKEALTFQYFNQSDHQGAPLAVFWICSLRIRMLCRCSGGNIAICSGVNCKTCMMRAAWKRKMKMLLRMLNVFFWPTSWTEQSRTTV